MLYSTVHCSAVRFKQNKPLRSCGNSALAPPVTLAVTGIGTYNNYLPSNNIILRNVEILKNSKIIKGHLLMPRMDDKVRFYLMECDGVMKST